MRERAVGMKEVGTGGTGRDNRRLGLDRALEWWTGMLVVSWHVSY